MTPRYIVWIDYPDSFFLCDTLAAALDIKAQHGGTIYEPLGTTAAEKVAAVQARRWDSDSSTHDYDGDEP